MESSTLRIRLVFADRSILSRTQRSDGMNRSWLLVKPHEHRTISDVCTHLLHIFKLHRSCPSGVLLSMGGFVLPPLESTQILKDKEIICVKRKEDVLADAIEAVDAENLLDDVEDDGMEPVDNGLLLLEDEKLEKETGEYQSESEEVDEDHLEDEASPAEAVSKKRKAFARLHSSKKKKHCLGVLNGAEDEVEAEDINNVDVDEFLPGKIISKKGNISKSKGKCIEDTNARSAVTSNTKLESPSNVKRSEQLQENVEEVKQVSTAPGVKKVPSRSARRKKAKRRWMREIAKISKKKPHPHPKPEVAKAVNKEDDGHPKGLLHWKQVLNKPVYKNTVEHQEANQNGNANTEIVPVVVRPGHIRFEPLDEDQATKQTKVSNEAFQWNGITSKKKGQKWGTEKFSTPRRNDSQKINKAISKMLATDIKVPIIDPNDFDKLPPCSLPKEGDVIAYRLLVLSSSWTPEFSSFRVGRIAYYDARNIVLMPLPEYPIDTDKMDKDGPNASPYGEDGTLEIKYSALVDVRNLKQSDSDAREAVSNGVNQTSQVDNKDAAENLVSNSNENKAIVSEDSNPGDGEVNPWDQFSKALNAMNTVTSEANHWSMVGSGLNPCSYSAPGPTVAQDANKAKSSEENDGQKGSSEENDSQKAGSWASWAVIKKTGPSENDSQKGSSWGRPWSSYGSSSGSSVREQSKDNDWCRGSSRGRGKPWSRGTPRGRGRGRG